MSSEGINNPAKRRRVARACDTCRRKKVRCDGVQAGSDPPSCTNCKAYGYECAFIDAPKKRGPPKGYIEALETRLQRMESILGGLVQNGDIPEGTISTSNLEWINVDETNFAADKVEESSKDPSLQKSSSHDGSSRSTSFSSHRADGYEHRHRSSDPNNPAYRSLSNSDSEESSSCGSKDEYGSSYDLNDSMGQLAIDETGQTRYLGNSSGIFLLKITNRVANGQIITVPRGEWQSSNKVNSTVYKLPSRELCDQMLDVYFTYVHPFLPFLDQHEVREKYAKLESNSSILLLLYAIFAIASRFIDQPAVRKDPNDPTTTGDGFFDQAKDLLKDEFDDAQLSTIHALLLMAAYQQGSKNSRAWLYIGLAIRTAQDMGLHRDSAKWSLDEKQTEIRKRAWWACYTFDRFISAGLGRPMTINESDCDVPFPVPGALPDDEKENVEAWIKTIKLAQILGRVLQHIYGIKSKHTTHAATDSVLASLDAELNTWRESLPASLQYDPSTPLADAKNHRHGHMHLMFYTIQILLHRPHIRGPKSKAPPSSIPSLTICTMAANNITHISYRSMKEGKLKIAWNFILYFFFTAAVMHVINALSGDDRFREVAKHGLRMSLKCLEYLKPFWFGAERCIFVIRDLLRVRNINLDGFNPNGTEHVDQNNNADGFETKVEGNIVTCLNSGTTGAQPKTQANSQHRVLFAPSASESPTTSPHVAATATDQYSQAIMQQMAAAAAAVVASQNTSNGAASNHSPNAQQSNQALAITNSSTSKQESSPQIPYEQSPSPASSSSSNSTSFMPFGDFMSTDNAFFPPNTDAFSADVNSVLFDEDDPMGTNNPFWAVPSTFDWNDWTDYMNGMHGLRATAATTAAASATSDIAAASLLSGVRGNVSLGSDVNNPQRIPHGL